MKMSRVSGSRGGSADVRVSGLIHDVFNERFVVSWQFPLLHAVVGHVACILFPHGPAEVPHERAAAVRHLFPDEDSIVVRIERTLHGMQAQRFVERRTHPIQGGIEKRNCRTVPRYKVPSDPPCPMYTKRRVASTVHDYGTSISHRSASAVPSSVGNSSWSRSPHFSRYSSSPSMSMILSKRRFGKSSPCFTTSTIRLSTFLS